MKKTICRVCSVCLLIMMLFLTSCGGGFFSEEPLQIASIDSELMYDGTTKITITYSDEEVEPSVFYIPRGEDGLVGAVGNGIKDFTCERDDTNRVTKVSVTFTDENLPAATFEVPDGLSIVGIRDAINPESQQRYIEFQYSDGGLSQQIFLPSGVDGVGIDDLQVNVNEDKSATMYIKFSDGTEKSLPIPAPQEGVGIESMSGEEIGEFYYINITYTNGEEAQIEFARNAKWYSGAYLPLDSEGENGDYFFDIAHQKIYLKANGTWENNVIVDFQSDKRPCVVTFNLNDNNDASLPKGVYETYRIERGSYFNSVGIDIPIPTRPGYIFKGWYTKSAITSPATMAAFTDLTVVASDLELFAIWEAEE